MKKSWAFRAVMQSALSLTDNIPRTCVHPHQHIFNFFVVLKENKIKINFGISHSLAMWGCRGSKGTPQGPPQVPQIRLAKRTTTDRHLYQQWFPYGTPSPTKWHSRMTWKPSSRSCPPSNWAQPEDRQQILVFNLTNPLYPCLFFYLSLLLLYHTFTLPTTNILTCTCASSSGQFDT